MEGITAKKDVEDSHYQNKLLEMQGIEDNEKSMIEQEIKEERELGKEKIEEEAKQKRDERLKVMEKKLNDFKKGGLAGEDEYKFDDMLAEYGNHVKQVDEEMKAWQRDQNDKLEDRLKQRREQRRREAEEQKKGLESQLNKDTQNQRTRFTNEMNQIQSLLKPVKDEEERLKMIVGDLHNSDAIKHVYTDFKLNDVSTTINDTEKRKIEAANEKDD